MRTFFNSCLSLVILVSFDAPLAAQNEPVDQMVSYPFTVDPENVYEYPDLVIENRDLRLQTGPVSVVPISCERGITGVMLIGNGTFHYAPEKEKVIDGRFRAVMLRFNPDEQSKIVSLEKGTKVSDRGVVEMSRHMLQVVIRHCWQSSKATESGRRQEVLVPPKGAFAAVLYSKEHGDLLISSDERTAVAHSFTDRKSLYEKK